MNFTKNSKSYDIQTFSPISAKLKNQTTQISSTIMENYLAKNLNLAELEAKMPFFRKIQYFIKSERFNGFFPNSIPNVLEDWSLYKELIISIAQNLR